jgi:ABC-2 type transport system ATP-binding protein
MNEATGEKDKTRMRDHAPVVHVENLVKRYGELVAVDHLSFDIASGEAFGLLGPNGSGKTTTINCILQLLSYDHGDISLFGRPMRPTSYDLKRQIGIVPQEVAVFDELTVRENIDSFCALYVSDRAKRRELVDRAIKFVGLQKFEKFRPKKLSGGLMRRLNIACGIAHEPSLIILDEPTVAVDPQSREAILGGIERLNREGATIIYTSHYMEEVERLCKRILIMDHGRAVASGTPDELKAMVGTGEKVSVETAEPSEQVLEDLRRLSCVRQATYEGGRIRVQCLNGEHNLADILGVLAKDNVSYGRVLSEPPTLNDVFLEITGRALRDEA